MPAYRRLLGSDWTGAQLSYGVGGEARNGFVAEARFGAFLGGTTYGVPFQHFTVAAVFVIPTGTRLHIALGHQFGVMVVEEPHTADGSAWTLSMGGFVEPSVDVWRHDTRRVHLDLHVGYDFVDAAKDNNAVTLAAGLGYSF
jgi:hypothetical protein